MGRIGSVALLKEVLKNILVSPVSGVGLEEIKLNWDNINIDISKTGISGFKFLATTVNTNQ